MRILFFATALLMAFVPPPPVWAARQPDRIEISVGELRFDALAAGPAGGQLVLLLHGFPQTSHAFHRLLPVLADAGFRAVAPDQRGYSPGARPAEVEAYAMGSLVADVIGMADVLGADRFHLVGHDWGGAVAWAVAGRHPDRIFSLTVLSTPHPGAFGRARSKPKGDRGAGDPVAGDPVAGDQKQRSSYMQVFAEEGSEAQFLADGAAILRSLLASLPAPDVEEYVRALGTEEALRGALNWYRALLSGVRTAASRRPAPISAPTLYVFGADDSVFSRQTADATAGFIEGPYTFHSLDGVGHWILEQVPERVETWLLDHLRRQRPAAASE